MDTPAQKEPAAAQGNAQNTQGATPMQKNVPMAVLAYIGPLVIVSYLTAKDDPFVKFHIKQGLILLVIEVAVWVLRMIFSWTFWRLFELLDVAVLIFAVIGIVYASRNEEKALPFIGSYARYFTF